MAYGDLYDELTEGHQQPLADPGRLPKPRTRGHLVQELAAQGYMAEIP